MSPSFFVNNPQKCLEASIYIHIFAGMHDLINLCGLNNTLYIGNYHLRKLSKINNTSQ